MCERDPQCRLYDGVGHQHILDFLQLLFALLHGRVKLTSYWNVLEKLQYAHGCTCKDQWCETAELS